MTSANVDLVRRVFDEYARGSFAAAAEFTHPDFEMRLQTSHPLAGTLRGPRDATKAMADWMESFEGFNGEAEQFIDAGGDRVVVAFRERGRPRGGSVDLDHRFGILYNELASGPVGKDDAAIGCRFDEEHDGRRPSSYSSPSSASRRLTGEAQLRCYSAASARRSTWPTSEDAGKQITSSAPAASKAAMYCLTVSASFAALAMICRA